jgi:predicted esterase
VLKLAVPQMLAGKMLEAAETLDRTRLLLQSAEPTAADHWAAALLVHPARRLIDPAGGSLAVRILGAYPAGGLPPGLTLRLRFLAAESAKQLSVTAVAISKLPIDATIATDNLPDGDHTLRVDVVDGNNVLASYTTGISAVTHLRERLDRLTTPASRINSQSMDARSLRALQGRLMLLTYPTAPETNYPAARLLAEAEALLKAVQAGQEFYGPQRTGQFWLAIPTAFSDAPVRLFVPDGAKAGKPLPIVVALHGLGGSENLFFDAYGFGLIARLAQERGWMVVSPRAGGLFDGAPPVPVIVDELAKVYPIDKQRVYVVGHSMGAMHAIALAQEAPGRFAAIAALGGGGTVTKPDAFRELPVFIGCGGDDFLLGPAKGLAKFLEKAGATRVAYKEYAGVEHMLIVQEALPDVFRFFEKRQSAALRRRVPRESFRSAASRINT